MKFPKQKRGAVLKTELSFDGGLSRDGINAEGKLKDMLNLQAENGELIVRPSLKLKGTSEMTAVPTGFFNADGMTAAVSIGDTVKIAFFDRDGSLFKEITGDFTVDTMNMLIGGDDVRFYYAEDYDASSSSIDFVWGDTSLDKKTLEDIGYVPTVSVGGRGYLNENDENEIHYEFNGSQYESENIISDAYIVKQTSEYLKNVYVLPYPIEENATVYTEYIDNWYNIYEHGFQTGDNGEFLTDTADEDMDQLRLQMFSDSRNVIIFEQPGVVYGRQNSPLGSNKCNNFIIKITQGYGSSSIGVCRRCAVFDGGDYRTWILFGSKTEVATVWLTGYGDKTYFPKCGKYVIGRSNEAVTAVLQVGDRLAVLKEGSLWLCDIKNGDRFTDDELAAGLCDRSCGQTVEMDIAKIADIGCDCPDTAASCDGRLVWLNSDGKIHMMTAVQNPDERDVKELSYIIEPWLKKHTADELKKASAVYCDGKYYLLVENEMFVLDCRANAMDNYTSYADDLTAQKKLVWFVWNVAADGAEWCRIAEGSVPMLYGMCDGKLICCALDGEDGADCTDGENAVPISWCAETALYDFGKPDSYKRAGRLTALISSPSRVKAAILNENGCDGCDEIAAGDRHFATVRGAEKSLLLGAKFEGSGKAEISDITLSAAETTHKI